MTFDEIVTVVLNRCGNRAGSTELVSASFVELKAIQEQLEESPEPPWFLMSESSLAQTTIGEPRVRLPSDFLLEEETVDLWIQQVDGDWKSLGKVEYDVVKGSSQNSDNSLPTCYAIRGDYFYLGPAPDKAYNLRMSYYKKQSVPVPGGSNGWTEHASDLIINELGWVISGEYLSDAKKQQSFTNGITRANAKLAAKTIIREEVNQVGQL